MPVLISKKLTYIKLLLSMYIVHTYLNSTENLAFFLLKISSGLKRNNVLVLSGGQIYLEVVF